jgi:hypothetical protein
MLFGASGDTTGYTASFNGTIPTSATTVLTNTTVTRFDMGYTPSDCQTHIFEFIAYDRKLTTTEYGQIMSYLKTKYQL